MLQNWRWDDIGALSADRGITLLRLIGLVIWGLIIFSLVPSRKTAIAYTLIFGLMVLASYLGAAGIVYYVGRMIYKVNKVGRKG